MSHNIAGLTFPSSGPSADLAANCLTMMTLREEVPLDQAGDFHPC